MKRWRILSFLALALGALYLTVSGLSLYHYRKMLDVFAYYGVSDEVQLSVPEIAQTRAQLMSSFILLLITGVLVLCAAVGLYLAKSWARGMWLVLISLLTLLHILRLVSDYQQSSFIFLERIVEVLLVGGLAALSWFWARRENNMSAVQPTPRLQGHDDSVS
ncbi:MAG TPA: hypothetical protein VJT09_04915 [Pyrinomonadaceae bacterium]|nr:hypothetical protein [Pyrinomonadaceae bacterium]